MKSKTQRNKKRIRESQKLRKMITEKRVNLEKLGMTKKEARWWSERLARRELKHNGVRI